MLIQLSSRLVTVVLPENERQSSQIEKTIDGGYLNDNGTRIEVFALIVMSRRAVTDFTHACIIQQLSRADFKRDSRDQEERSILVVVEVHSPQYGELAVRDARS